MKTLKKLLCTVLIFCLLLCGLPVGARALEQGCLLTSFRVAGVAACILDTSKTVTATLPYGAELTSLIPIFTVSKGATVKYGNSPYEQGTIPVISGETALDFTSPVYFTVTSEDEKTANRYTITVTVANFPPGTKPEKYTVTFDAGDYGEATFVQGETDEDDHIVSLPAVINVKPGYTFLGWSTDGTEQKIIDQRTFKVQSDITFHAAYRQDAPPPPPPATNTTVEINADGSTVTVVVGPGGTTTTTVSWGDGKNSVIITSPAGTTITVKTGGNGTVANVNLPAQPAAPKPFTDVKSGDWFKGSVDAASGYGMFSGVGEKKFDPNGSMTRSMLASVLYNLSGKTGYGVGTGSFADVKTNDWYAAPVDWAAAVGVTSGTDKGFEPKAPLTREQLITMLYRYAQAIGTDSKKIQSLNSFPDGDKVADYAQAAMQWAVAEGFISGREQGRRNYLAPQGTATRAEVAAVLVRFAEYLKKR